MNKIKIFKEIEYEKWFEKAKNCPLQLTKLRCIVHGIGHCSIETCPMHYWLKT